MREIDSHNPFAYMGVEPYATPDFKKMDRDPTNADRKNFYVGQFWLNTTNNKVWVLTAISGNTSTWTPLTNSGILIDSYVTDSGTAVPSNYEMNLVGDGTFIGTTGSGNTATISFDATTADDGQLLIGATGGSAAWANLSSTGGTVLFIEGANSINIEVADGLSVLSSDSGSAVGSGQNIQLASAATNLTTSASGKTVTIDLDASITVATTLTMGALSEGVVQTNGAALWSSSNGTAGQLLIGGGAAPVWVNITSIGATIDITNGANSIDLSRPGITPESYTFYGFNVLTSGQVVESVTGDDTPYLIPFATEAFDTGGGFNVDTFTAPISGNYHLHLITQLQEDGSDYYRCYIYLPSGSVTHFFGITVPTDNRCTGYISSTTGRLFVVAQASCLVYMNAGETAQGYLQSGGDTYHYDDFFKEDLHSKYDETFIRSSFTGYLMNNI